VAAPPAYDVALGRLRAFAVLFVVFHHAILAYFPDVPLPDRFAGGPMLWRIFPVHDPTRWAAVPIIAAFGDMFGMALLFLRIV